MATVALFLLLSTFFLLLGRTTAGADRTPLRSLGLREACRTAARGVVSFSRLHERRDARMSGSRPLR